MAKKRKEDRTGGEEGKEEVRKMKIRLKEVQCG